MSYGLLQAFRSANNSTVLKSTDGLVSDYQVATRCGVSRRTVQTWRQRAVGPAYHRVGRAVRYKIKDVEVWLKSRRVSP